MPDTGYSGTPLAKKLSLKEGMSIWLHEMPEHVRTEIAPAGHIERPAPEPGIGGAHIFVRDAALMESLLIMLRSSIDPAGFVWVSWPKKASEVATDINEDRIRAIALPMGWVDVKVCAIDATWSGLKLMIRKELR